MDKGISDIKRIKIDGIFKNVVDSFWHGNHAIATEMSIVEIERVSLHLMRLFNEFSKEKYKTFRQMFLDKKKKTDEAIPEEAFDLLLDELPSISQELRGHLNEVLSMCVTQGDGSKFAPGDFNNIPGGFYKNVVKAAWNANEDQVIDIWGDVQALIKKKSDKSPTQGEQEEAPPQEARTAEVTMPSAETKPLKVGTADENPTR